MCTSEHEDVGLVARIRGGDTAAFERLYDKYKRHLYQTALAITGDQGAAEEVVQDSFVRAHRAMGKVVTSGSVSPWLHRIAVNLACNWANRNRRWSSALDIWLERLIAPGLAPDQAAEQVEVDEIVREALKRLNSTQRAVIVLFYVQGFTLAELAYIMDCPVGTVKSRLHYACKAFRERLSEDTRLPSEIIYGAELGKA
jgi:RNA polymerase sigma-70 factor (ECF subfamily)